MQLTGFKAPDNIWVEVILPDGRHAWVNSSYMVIGVTVDQMTVSSD